MTETTYTVVGMTCDHCVRAVTSEVSRVPGVEDVEVDLVTGQVRVTSHEPVDDEAIVAAVEEAGYGVSS
ncbi:MAG: heavy-metal-associated domain-containing protein [Acidimicrobiia bacterium]